MKKLIDYLNKLPKIDRAAFASACETSEGYMRKCASVGGCLQPSACNTVERLTAGAVTRQDLRPHDYWRIWPDLPAPAPLPEQEQTA